MGRGLDSFKSRMATGHSGAHPARSNLPLPVSLPGACAVAVPADGAKIEHARGGGARGVRRREGAVRAAARWRLEVGGLIPLLNPSCAVSRGPASVLGSKLPPFPLRTSR